MQEKKSERKYETEREKTVDNMRSKHTAYPNTNLN